MLFFLKRNYKSQGHFLFLSTRTFPGMMNPETISLRRNSQALVLTRSELLGNNPVGKLE